MTDLELQDKINSRLSFLLSQDGQYLGKLTLNKFDTESILNQYGSYGSRFATTSIWNQYSTYGSRYSSYSPFNPYTSTPPFIYLRGRIVGYLTVNGFMFNRLHPDDLVNWMAQNNL